MCLLITWITIFTWWFRQLAKCNTLYVCFFCYAMCSGCIFYPSTVGTTFQQTGLLIRDGFIQSRVGCRETFVCAGVGNTLVWRRFGLRGTLQPSGDRLTINVSCCLRPSSLPSPPCSNLIVLTIVLMQTTRISTDEDDVFSFTSLLTFNPVLHGDTGGFTCTIHPRTQTARLVVDLCKACRTVPH